MTAPIDHQPSPARGTPLRHGGFTLIATGFCIGVLAGVVELLLLGVERYQLFRTIVRSREVIWLAPLGYAIAFSCLGALLALLGYRRRGFGPAIAIGLPVFLASAGVLLLYENRLHPVAQALLAVGIAMQATRLAGTRWNAALVRRGAAVLALLLSFTIITSLAANRIRERRALAALPTARTGAPNVLLIILDTVRSMELSVYGYDRPTTPFLSQFASQGVAFDDAVAPAPWTLLTHATLFTGQLRGVHHADWHSRLDPAVPTLAAIFGREGYRTGGFSANVVMAGWEFGFARDFAHFEDHDLSPAELLNNTTVGKFLADHVRVRRLLDNWEVLGRNSADDINRKALEWLDHSGDRPYFVFLNYFDAHVPYLPPEPFAGKFGVSRPPVSLRSRIRGFLLPTPKAQKSKAAYDGAIAYMDDRIGRLLDSLRQKGLLENTLVVVTADHGELFGENRLYGHANSLYYPTLQVPLLLSMPGRVPANRRVPGPITLRDVPATILDLAGVSGAPRLPGVSLARFWSDLPPAPPTPILSEVSGLPNLGTKIPIGRGDMVSLVRDSLHYIRNGDGVEELYNIRWDKTESHPLGAEFSSQLAAMRQAVESTYVRNRALAVH